MISFPLIALVAAAGLALSAGAWIHGRSHGIEITEVRYAAQAAEANREARRFEQQRTREVQDAQDARDTQIRSINARLTDALDRLRERPGRLPEPSRSACQGATGAELSGADAAFLERFSARADSLRAELAACQDREHAALKR
jgi:hypothetical protein